MAFTLALAALAVTAAALHWAMWYSPRPHAAVPQWADAPARLLVDERWDARLWVAYPHQNLAGAADLGAGDLPSFGPFALPPARELAVAWHPGTGASTERFQAAVRVFPGLARIARLAGALAGNAWLEGGEVVAGGRRGRVSWRGSLWTFGNDDASPAAPAPPTPPELGPPEALVAAFAASRGRLDFLGTGPFGVSRLGRDWLIRDLGRPPPARLPEMRIALAVEGLWTGPGVTTGPDQRDPIAVLVVRSSGSASKGYSWQVLALLGPRSGRFGGTSNILSVPSAVALSSDGGTSGRFTLPGERLLERLGAEIGSEILGDWQATWSDRRGEQLGRQLALLLERLPSPAETSDRGWAAMVEPATLTALARELVTGLDRSALGLIPRSSDGLDWRLVLAVAGRFEGSGRMVLEGRMGAVRVTTATNSETNLD